MDDGSNMIYMNNQMDKDYEERISKRMRQGFFEVSECLRTGIKRGDTVYQVGYGGTVYPSVVMFIFEISDVLFMFVTDNVWFASDAVAGDPACSEPHVFRDKEEAERYSKKLANER